MRKGAFLRNISNFVSNSFLKYKQFKEPSKATDVTSVFLKSKLQIHQSNSQKMPRLKKAEVAREATAQGYSQIPTKDPTLISFQKDGTRLNVWTSTGTVGTAVTHPSKVFIAIFIFQTFYCLFLCSMCCCHIICEKRKTNTVFFAVTKTQTHIYTHTHTHTHTQRHRDTHTNIKQKGKTQLFRRNVSKQEMRDIFQNPRHHSGKGYYTKKKSDTKSYLERCQQSTFCEKIFYILLCLFSSQNFPYFCFQ